MAQVKFLEMTERYGGSAAPLVGYFISPTGNDSTGTGTEGNPWATVGKFLTAAGAAGDTLYCRGGTYSLSAQIVLNKSGSSGNPITIRNYPGETPIFNATSNSNTGGHSVFRLSSVSWWYIYCLEVCYSPGYGIYLTGTTNNVSIEFCNVHHNVRLDSSGANIYGDSTINNIVIVNNDSHHASINQGSGTGGDGIAINFSQQTGNVIRGNRCWRNHDDGIDLWDAANVLVENNWSWENAYDDTLTGTSGNGVGFKLGGGGSGDGNHIVRRNLAWNNWRNGFDDNSANVPMVVYNNTGYGNSVSGSSNFAFYTAAAHVLKNNLALTPNTVSFHASIVQAYNSWNNPPNVTVTSGDFLSMDFSANTGSRKTDGSQPDSNFLHLAPGSDCINAGTDVGLSYNSSAPDLGAFET